MLRAAVTAVAMMLAACSSCPDTCESTGTELRLVRASGEFGAPGERLRFRVQSNLGLTVTDCTMAAANGLSECAATGVTVFVVNTHELTLRFSPLPNTVTVSVARAADDSIVAGPGTAQFASKTDDACSCNTGQSATIAM